VKRIAYLAMATLVALVILVPNATAQEMMDESMMNESMMTDESMMEQQPSIMDESMMMEQSKMEQKMDQPEMMEKGKMEKGKMEMPMTGGPSLGLLLLPAAALLVGMGLMAGYVVRHRR
jgi:hypothetical protein